MKRPWEAYAARFDAMSRRERVLVAVALLVGVALLGQTVFVDPLLVKQGAHGKQIKQKASDLSTIQSQLAAARSRMQDPDAANRAALGQVRKEVADIDARLKGMEKTLVAPERMADLLEDILRHNRGLKLLGLRTLPAGALVERREAKPDTGAAPAGTEASIFKHGVEITVQGSYADLLAYLSQLEKLPQQMFWSRVHFKVDEYPKATLTLTVYTLSLDKAWLIV